MRRLKINPKITNRTTISLEKYLFEVSKEQLISVKEETELASRIKEGDSDALSKLIQANLRFVVSVAKQYQNQGLELPDLINEGNMGLIKAAQRYDETKGFKFISYAVWWIRQSIIQAISSKGRLVKLPANKSVLASRLVKKTISLEQELMREPTTEEIAEALETSSEITRSLIQASTYPISVDMPNDFGDNEKLSDKMESNKETQPDKNLMLDSLRNELNRVLNLLDEREALIIIHYYGLETGTPLTLDDIACKLDLTKERVRQIKNSALRHLKIKSSRELLRSYLG